MPRPGIQQSCDAAVGDDRERIALRINDEVVRRLFGLGLHLQGTAEMVDGPARDRLNVAIEVLDTTIVELRKAIFAVVICSSSADHDARLSTTFNAPVSAARLNTS
jgi:hypothetical protein